MYFTNYHCRRTPTVVYIVIYCAEYSWSRVQRCTLPLSLALAGTLHGPTSTYGESLIGCEEGMNVMAFTFWIGSAQTVSPIHQGWRGRVVGLRVCIDIVAEPAAEPDEESAEASQGLLPHERATMILSRRRLRLVRWRARRGAQVGWASRAASRSGAVGHRVALITRRRRQCWHLPAYPFTAPRALARSRECIHHLNPPPPFIIHGILDETQPGQVVRARLASMSQAPAACPACTCLC